MHNSQVISFSGRHIPQMITQQHFVQCMHASYHSSKSANLKRVNSLGLSDAIWRCRSGSTLAHVMTCFKHQAITWTTILSVCSVTQFVSVCSPKDHFTRYLSHQLLKIQESEHYISTLPFKFPRAEWVKNQTGLHQSTSFVIFYGLL